MSLSKEDEETWYELALLSAARQLTEFLNGSSRVLARSLVIFAGGDAALFALVTVASALHHDRLAMARDVAYSALAVVSCALGVLGAKKLDRGVILLYFVLVGFGLTSSSANLTYNITERAKQDSVCAHVAESEAAADAARGILDRCATQLFLLNAKLALLGATVFGQLVSAYLALRLSERIQEESDASEESKKLEVLNAIGFRSRADMQMMGSGRGGGGGGGGGGAKADRTGAISSDGPLARKSRSHTVSMPRGGG